MPDLPGGLTLEQAWRTARLAWEKATSAGVAVWGQIGGLLSAQTDLVAEFATKGAKFASVEDSGDYSATPFAVTSTPAIHRFFTGAQNHIVEFPAGLSTDPTPYGKFTAPAANTLTLRRVSGSAVSINGVASDGFTWVVPAGGTVEWILQASNTFLLRGDTTTTLLLQGAIDGNTHRIFGHRLRIYRNTTAQTLSTANFKSGSVLIHTGGAVTYTLPSRLSSGLTEYAEEFTVHNGGSGAITWSASGVTLTGDTGTLAAGETAWLLQHHDGTTERVLIRMTA